MAFLGVLVFVLLLVEFNRRLGVFPPVDDIFGDCSEFFELQRE